MKAKHLSVLLMALVLSAPTIFCSASKTTTEEPATSPMVENKLTTEEASAMTKRVEEIRDMDKTDMTVSEKRELKKELKETKENIRKDGGYIYIGTGTLLLIIILLLIL
jgi:glucosamine 6-phosphate synthetase-like amidotransferase/phosphosugar isomerase protein